MNSIIVKDKDGILHVGHKEFHYYETICNKFISDFEPKEDIVISKHKKCDICFTSARIFKVHS